MIGKGGIRQRSRVTSLLLLCLLGSTQTCGQIGLCILNYRSSLLNSSKIEIDVRIIPAMKTAIVASQWKKVIEMRVDANVKKSQR